nr:hypothetical protein [Nitrosomonas nitrosa]
MSSRRESILSALFETLRSTLTASVRRNEALPEKVPSTGLVVLRDGEPGEPEILLSPLSYLWRHRAPVDVVVGGATQAERDAALDTLLTSIGSVLDANRTLGGLVDWLEIGPPSFEIVPIEGAAPIKGAVVPVILHYETSSPLS